MAEKNSREFSEKLKPFLEKLIILPTQLANTGLIFGHREKNSRENNSKLKEKLKTQENISKFRHF